MNLPSRRVLVAIAVILAGIGAVSVPFLLHSPTPQASSGNGGGGSSTTNNNNSHTTTGTNPTTSATSSGANGAGSNGQSGSSEGTIGGSATCDEDNSPDPSHTDHGNHKGEQKHNDLQTVKDDVDKAFAMVKAMGAKNPAFLSMHSTKADNDTVRGNSANAHAIHHADNGCAEDEEDSDE